MLRDAVRLSFTLPEVIMRSCIKTLLHAVFLLSVVPIDALADDTELQGWAINRSTPTRCAEEDNVNVVLFKPGIKQFRLTASHPKYEIGQDNCRADFTNCPPALADGPPRERDQFTKLYDDGTNVVEIAVVDGWWRKNDFVANVAGNSARGHYVRLYRKVKDEAAYPQTIVIYQDGNLRLKGQPPVGRNDTCFGSSFIIGPAKSSDRPFVEIERIDVVPSNVEVDLFLFYGKLGSAHLVLNSNREASTIVANVRYTTDAQIPFGTFRSMWVADGNADVDRMRAAAGEYSILDWKRVKSSAWSFYRRVRSKHNTSAPDFAVEVLR